MFDERGSASLYGGLGALPQCGPGTKPLVRGSGAMPPYEIMTFETPNLALFSQLFSVARNQQ